MCEAPCPELRLLPLDHAQSTQHTQPARQTAATAKTHRPCAALRCLRPHTSIPASTRRTLRSCASLSRCSASSRPLLSRSACSSRREASWPRRAASFSAMSWGWVVCAGSLCVGRVYQPSHTCITGKLLHTSKQCNEMLHDSSCATHPANALLLGPQLLCAPVQRTRLALQGWKGGSTDVSTSDKSRVLPSYAPCPALPTCSSCSRISSAIMRRWCSSSSPDRCCSTSACGPSGHGDSSG
jgi:hypothetical protein